MISGITSSNRYGEAPRRKVSGSREYLVLVFLRTTRATLHEKTETNIKIYHPFLNGPSSTQKAP
jgi:hypothetical protein